MAAQFKERLDAHAVARIGAAITAVAPDFAAPKFSAAVVPGLAERELIARVEHIADGIAAHLLRPFPDAAAVLVAALGAPVPTEAPDVSLDDGPLRGFLVWPLTRFKIGRAHV